MDKLTLNNANIRINLEEIEESISVSQLNKLAKTLLENNMPIVWIKGEISGIRTYSHIYFDLKDENAKISCVVFSGILSLLDFTLENGQQIEVRGKVTIYPQNGGYQINVERIRKVGLGELWEAYNRLIAKLRLEGLFDAIHKKSIPLFPRAVGVVTSSVGAVIRDVITTLKRRMPNILIIVYHTAVQGSDASMQISRAIKTANQRNEVDVLIVCRGGGSMEDLWCFNEEIVAREVFMSNIPIISAVGHETDTTIIDFVSDLRAPTPTAAAEMVAKNKNEWESLINNLHNKLFNSFIYKLDNSRKKFDLYKVHIRHLNPINQLREKKSFLTNYMNQLNLLLKQKVVYYKNNLQFINNQLLKNKTNIDSHLVTLNQLENRLSLGINNLLSIKKQQINIQSKHLALVSPTSILSRGYAIVRNRHNEVISSAADIKNHERISIMLSDDTLSAIIDKNHNNQQDELI